MKESGFDIFGNYQQKLYPLHPFIRSPAGGPRRSLKRSVFDAPFFLSPSLSTDRRVRYSIPATAPCDVLKGHDLAIRDGTLKSAGVVLRCVHNQWQHLAVWVNPVTFGFCSVVYTRTVVRTISKSRGTSGRETARPCYR